MSSFRRIRFWSRKSDTDAEAFPSNSNACGLVVWVHWLSVSHSRSSRSQCSTLFFSRWLFDKPLSPRSDGKPYDEIRSSLAVRISSNRGTCFSSVSIGAIDPVIMLRHSFLDRPWCAASWSPLAREYFATDYISLRSKSWSKATCRIEASFHARETKNDPTQLYTDNVAILPKRYRGMLRITRHGLCLICIIASISLGIYRIIVAGSRVSSKAWASHPPAYFVVVRTGCDC